MRYLRIPQGEIEGENPETLYEIDEDELPTRVLYILPDKRVGSTFPYYFNPYTQLHEDTVPEPSGIEGEMKNLEGEAAYRKLAELTGVSFQELKEEVETLEKMKFEEYLEREKEIEEQRKISAEEFELEWSQYLTEWKDYWEDVQSRYKVSQVCEGVISVFQPRGAIIKLDKKSIGFISEVDYLEIQSRTNDIWYSGKKMETEVVGFDQLNMRVKLKFRRMKK